MSRKRPAHRIDVEKIVLTNGGINPHQSTSLRMRVQSELQRMMRDERFIAGLAAQDVSEVVVPAQVSSGNEAHLALGIVQGIAHAVRNGGDR
jgi:hypothetical protein